MARFWPERLSEDHGLTAVFPREAVTVKRRADVSSAPEVRKPARTADRSLSVLCKEPRDPVKVQQAGLRHA